MDVSLDHGMLRWRVYQAERQLSSFLISQNGIKQTTALGRKHVYERPAHEPDHHTHISSSGKKAHAGDDQSPDGSIIGTEDPASSGRPGGRRSTGGNCPWQRDHCSIIDCDGLYRHPATAGRRFK